MSQAKTKIIQANNSGVSGTVSLEQYLGVETKIRGEISGLTPGKHGFHIHENGSLADECVGAGGHYNPYGKEHGAPEDENRHVGALGNIEAGSDGVAKFEISDRLVDLLGQYSVIGRTIVVHADADDLGLGSAPSSKLSGNSGTRVACGIIQQETPIVAADQHSHDENVYGYSVDIIMGLFFFISALEFTFVFSLPLQVVPMGLLMAYLMFQPFEGGTDELDFSIGQYILDVMVLEAGFGSVFGIFVVIWFISIWPFWGIVEEIFNVCQVDLNPVSWWNVLTKQDWGQLILNALFGWTIQAFVGLTFMIATPITIQFFDLPSQFIQ